ncbi:MAG: response regulator transcription factor [Pelolinea sp.]|jgi:DNA-binding CsgD family transcriptional regulator|nr:response regulator transcription factor [Pelolinea sp.]
MTSIQPMTTRKKAIKNGPPRTTLTRRQNECLRLTASGLTARAIARQLGITERMVRVHLSAVRDRLGAHSTAEAVYTALKQDILD